MANKNLYLIGTIHTDLEGPRRLEGLLRDISPNIIALEFHEDNEDMMKLRKSPEAQEGEINRIFSEAGLILTPEQRSTLLEVGRILDSNQGYELRTCREYVQVNPKKRLEYIDLPFLENGKQEFFDGCAAGINLMFGQIAQTPEKRGPFLEKLSKGKTDFIETLQKQSDIGYRNAEVMEELAEFLRDPETFEIYKKQLPPNVFQVLEQILSSKRDEAMANRVRELYNIGSHKLVTVTGLLHTPELKSRLLDLKPTTMTLVDYDDR